MDEEKGYVYVRYQLNDEGQKQAHRYRLFLAFEGAYGKGQKVDEEEIVRARLELPAMIEVLDDADLVAVWMLAGSLANVPRSDLLAPSAALVW